MESDLLVWLEGFQDGDQRVDGSLNGDSISEGVMRSVVGRNDRCAVFGVNLF